MPWYSTPFGRDGLITALQTAVGRLRSSRAACLRFLAATQATERDADARRRAGQDRARDARRRDGARWARCRSAATTAAVDSTPLFVVLAGAYLQRTGDLRADPRIWPNVERRSSGSTTTATPTATASSSTRAQRATGWCKQGWKDSRGLGLPRRRHAGRGADRAVRGAGLRVRRLARRRAHGRAALRRRRNARRASAARRATLRERFEARVLVRGARHLRAGARRRQAAVPGAQRRTPGHACGRGIVDSDERAQRVARQRCSTRAVRRLGHPHARRGRGALQPDVVPQRLGVAARQRADRARPGRYGFMDAAVRVFNAFFESATLLPLHRLPELYCGFAKTSNLGPVPYPVACSPQAWAVGSVYMMLGALLGLDIDAQQRTLVFRSSQLPCDVKWLHIANWRVGEGVCDMEFRRHGRDVALHVNGKPDGWTVMTLK